MIYPDVLQAIGHTPLVEIRRLNPYPGVKILAKLEAKNPGGSIKDRVALAMIEAAERAGELTPGKTVIEATSGNTGIGLAMVCAVKGYPLRLLMASTASRERRQIMLAYGAEIQLTPGHLSTDGAIEEAYRMAREEGDKYVLMDQFNNPASIDAHYHGTGPEIWEQTNGQVTHVVATLGTSGTIMGIAKRLRELSDTAKVIALEPHPSHKLQGLKNMHASYPPGIFDRRGPHEIRPVEDEPSFEMCRRLAREEGLFVGMSAGAAMAGAVELAGELHAKGEPGLIVVIFPDGGERYLSTPLFAPPPARGLRLFDVAAGKRAMLATETVGEAPAAGLFTLGPALDRLDEVDAWRRVILMDMMTARLRRAGREARAVVSLADMDDNALHAARDATLPREEYARRALDYAHALGKTLGVGETLSFRLAGDSAETGLAICRKLLAKGAAYEKLRSVYFDVLRAPDYGAMSSVDLDKLSLGKTVDLDEYAKDNPKDFTLLKRASLQDLKTGDCMKTEWGNVRPSWFLQHAAVAVDSLDQVSVFLASEAHSFPHLENFRAILAIGRGVAPEAWLLCGRAHAEDKDATGQEPPQATAHGGSHEPAGAGTVAAASAFFADGQETSSSAVGEATIRPGVKRLLEAMPPQALRMWLLSTAYRKPLVISEQSLAMWRKNQARTQHAAGELVLAAGDAPPPSQPGDVAGTLLQALDDAVDDDLSLHDFWPALFAFCRSAVTRIKNDAMPPEEAADCWRALREVDAVLRMLDHDALPLPRSQWPPEAAALAAQRETARAAKDFAKADALRGELAALGFDVEDAPGGARLVPRRREEA